MQQRIIALRTMHGLKIDKCSSSAASWGQAPWRPPQGAALLAILKPGGKHAEGDGAPG